jgi:GntR family transcriptional repressor for pyruvate dehydrogenase complex
MLNKQQERTSISRGDISAPHLPYGACQIYQLIRERRYAPGDRIPSERDLAAKFSVTRAAIREELSVLESLRIVERRPQSGVFVCEIAREGSLDALILEADLGLPVTIDDVRSLNEFRTMIELHAVVLACQRRTEADLRKLDAIIAATKSLLAAGASLSDMDAQFHLAVCAATQNQIMVRAANSFWLASKRRRDVYFAQPGHGARSLDHHDRIVQTIAAQDTDAARAAMHDHLGGAERFWLATLAEPIPAAAMPANVEQVA